LILGGISIGFLVAHRFNIDRSPIVRAKARPSLAAVPPREWALLGVEEIVSRCEASVALVAGPHSAGSGFLVRPGLVVTNAHVVVGVPASDLRVHFPSAAGGRRGPLRVVVVYFDERRDLAILAVDSPLPALEVNDEHSFRKGQEVVFIGNPVIGGEHILEIAVGRGVIGSFTTIDGLGFYQLSAAINGGNSGGPVLGMDGRVIGVVTAKAAREEGLGICVPAVDLAAAIKAVSGGDTAWRARESAHHASTVRPPDHVASRAGDRRSTPAPVEPPAPGPRVLGPREAAAEVLAAEAAQARAFSATRTLKTPMSIVRSADVDGGRRSAFLLLHPDGTFFSGFTGGVPDRLYRGEDRFFWETASPEELAVMWAGRGRDGDFQVESAKRAGGRLNASMVDRKTGKRYALRMNGCDGSGDAIFEMVSID
jgi:Trypsin-like peptidase domain